MAVQCSARIHKNDHARTLATGFTIQALSHPFSAWNLDINILKISSIAPAAKDGTIPRGSSTKAFIFSSGGHFLMNSSTALWEKDEVWRTPPWFDQIFKLMAVPAANDGNNHHWPLLLPKLPGLAFFCLFGFLVGEGRGEGVRYDTSLVWQNWSKLVSWWQCRSSLF